MKRTMIFRYSLLAGLVLTAALGMSSASHAGETGRAIVSVMDTSGTPINDFQVRLIRTTGAHDPPRPFLSKTWLSCEEGILVTPRLTIGDRQGQLRLEHLQPGHYQIDVEAEGYRMSLPDGLSRVILQRHDFLIVCPDSAISESADRGSLFMSTHHFDVHAGKTANVKIVMAPTWTVLGSVSFSGDSSSSEAKRQELLSQVRCRQDGPNGNGSFRPDEEGSFKLVRTGTGTLTVKVGRPVGKEMDHNYKGPWEHVFAIQVEPHRTYVLPKLLVKEPRAETQSNKTNAGDGK